MKSQISVQKELVARQRERKAQRTDFSKLVEDIDGYKQDTVSIIVDVDSIHEATDDSNRKVAEASDRSGCLDFVWNPDDLDTEINEGDRLKIHNAKVTEKWITSEKGNYARPFLLLDQQVEQVEHTSRPDWVLEA